ncbi:cytochrome c' [mine drainage metagenome]|uniref:Cytochrome c n=1 Tax=mine drainage metagenome TaxID=410659 RepID=A0A1J5RR70_9ZZZZ
MKNVLRSIAVVAGLLAFAGAAQAEFAKPAQAVHYRKSVFYVMGHHTAILGAMLEGRIPFDTQRALSEAQIIEFMSHLPWRAFGPGTDVRGTDAKSSIWHERQRFQADAQDLERLTPRLTAAAQTGQLSQMRVVFGQTVKTCKSCHDSFRN